MSKSDDYCKKDAARLLAKESDKGPTEKMAVEREKAGQEESASASSCTPARVLKNTSNEEEFERMEPRNTFSTENEELMPDNSELA